MARHNFRPTKVIKLTPQQLSKRIQEGYCPYCNDKDGNNHQCIQPCQFMMKEEECIAEFDKACSKGDEPAVVETDGQMEVSVHAIEGFHNNKTITLSGKRGRQQFSILVDGKYSQLLG